TTLPPGMVGLEHGLVIGSASVLYLIEFAVDRVPLIDHAWEAVHTLIRPATAGLLAWLALQGAPAWLQAGGTAAAAAVALAAHGSKAGLRLIVSTRASEARRRSLLRTALSLLEDLAAVGIAVAALLHPNVAIGVMAAGGALLLLGGPRLWRASSLGVRAVLARTRGFFEGRGWRTREQLPRTVRAAIPVEPLGWTPAHAAPAAVSGLPGIGEYRNGWLVFTHEGPRFLYRTLLRTHIVPLPRPSEVRLRRGLVTDALDIHCSPNGDRRAPREFTIFLLKDGPSPQVALSELTTDPS
ncbi:MAG TPA: DUF4126 family protein, partial [Longimicrobiales bacterium]|nr:DUF4126 family protein [Longimicrobiales bacterium]